METPKAAAFPIVTAPGVVAGGVSSLPVGVLGYVNRLAEACLLSPADYQQCIRAAGKQRSTVRVAVALTAGACTGLPTAKMSASCGTTPPRTPAS